MWMKEKKGSSGRWKEGWEGNMVEYNLYNPNGREAGEDNEKERV